MAALDYATDWYCWWDWEFGTMTGSRRPGGASGVFAVLRISRDGVRIDQPGAGGDAAIVADPGELGLRLQSLGGSARTRAGVDLLIEPDRYLKRHLSSLRLPRSRVLAMARLDYATATPFKPDDCFLVMPQYREDTAESAYYIVRRDHIQPVLDSLRGARLAVRTIGLVDAGTVILPDRDSLAQMRKPSAPVALAGAVTWWAAAAAVLGLLSIFGVQHWRYSVALGAIDQQIEVAQREAAVAQGIIDERYRRVSRIAAARSAKSEAVPLVRVLEELARTLPDATWLTAIDFRDATVTFSGISSSAPALIPALEASSLFRTPTFSQQVVRATDQDGERFTITMQLEQADG